MPRTNAGQKLGEELAELIPNVVFLDELLDLLEQAEDQAIAVGMLEAVKRLKGLAAKIEGDQEVRK